jgi:type I restriction enzyme S subunit
MGKWVKERLDKIMEVNPKSDCLPSEFIYIDLESVKQGRLLQQKIVGKDGAPSRAQRTLKPKDVLFQLVRPYQQNNYYFEPHDERDYVASTGYAVLRTDQDSKFCYFLLHRNEFQNRVEALCTGTGYPAITPKELSRIDICHPVSLDEQRHIAEILTTCDEVIEKSETVVGKYRAIKAGMLKDLFTRGIGKNGKLRPPPESAPQLYKDTALGKVPREWEIKNLGEIGRFVAGNGFPLQYQGRKDGQYPFFKVSDFNGWANTNVMSIANHYVSDDVVRILGCNVIPARSIVFAKIGAAIMLERKRMVAVASCIDNNMMSLQVDGANDSLVLHFLQNYKFSDLVEATALPALKTTSLKKICLAIPRDPAEQQQIAERLSAIDAKIADELAVIAKYRKVKAGLMARLLTPPDMEVE